MSQLLQAQEWSRPSGIQADWTQYHADERGDKPAKWDQIMSEIDVTNLKPDDHTIVRDYASPNILQLVTNDKNEEPVWPIGYQMACWELREGHLRWCAAAKHLYRRDQDTSIGGPQTLQHSWHVVGNIDDEYAVAKSDHNERICKTIIHESQRTDWFRQAHRGIRVGNRAWIRDEGQPIKYIPDCSGQDLAITESLPDDASDPEGRKRVEDQAFEIMQELTTGYTPAEAGASRDNLIRMFATPFLEPHKLYTYVLSGAGGNGKSLLAEKLINNVLGDKRVASFDAAGYLGITGGYDKADQMAQMDGAVFAIDDETPAIYEKMIAPLRGLSTGRPQYARRIQGIGRMVRPTATIILLTNEIFYDSDQNSDARRFVKVQFAPADSHTSADWKRIKTFMEQHPSAFYALSARLWQEVGDTANKVQLAPTRLNEQEGWIVSQLEANQNRFGTRLASRTAYRSMFHHNISDSLAAVMGLKTVYTRKLDKSRRQAALAVANPDRYAPWLDMWRADSDDEDGDSNE